MNFQIRGLMLCCLISTALAVEYGALYDTRDGQVYRTVVIGNQEWMADNLNYGSMVSGIKAGSAQVDDSKVEKFCSQDSLALCGKGFGGLYQWAEAMGLPSTCNSTLCASILDTLHTVGLCPVGWHMPSTVDFDTLMNRMGGSGTAGASMKADSTGFSTWDNLAYNRVDTGGFSALPAGFRLDTGGFETQGIHAEFWAASEKLASKAQIRILSIYNPVVVLGNLNKTNGYSVRCLRDALPGAGTATDPFRVSTYEDLKRVGKGPNLLSAHYRLLADIDASESVLENDGAGFVPIGTTSTTYYPFTGSFHGNGHVIHNLYINRPNERYIGLFAELTGSIDSLGIMGGKVTGYAYVGGLAGISIGGNFLQNFDSLPIIGHMQSGGLLGFALDTTIIRNCWAKGSVELSVPATDSMGGSASEAGGLVGFTMDSFIDSSFATGNVHGVNNIGGLVGFHLNGLLQYSFATGAISSDSSDGGGLIGMNQGDVRNTLASGNISGLTNLGGLIGYSLKSLFDSYATGNVTGTGKKIGGLIGYSFDQVFNSHATGSIKGSSIVGGLIGAYNYHTDGDTLVVNSYATGNVTADSNYVGGLIGFNYAKLINTYATGNVRAAGHDVGGLIGINYGRSIDSSYATGNVLAHNHFTGGLIGTTHSTNIRNSYAEGSVTSDSSDVGGLIGMSSGNLNACFATGKITGAQNVGGLIGVSYDTIANSYASGDVTGSTGFTGGLIGLAFGTYQNVHASGNVKGHFYTGGLIGIMQGYSLLDGDASGSVTADSAYVGGLIGKSYGKIVRTHASGAVHGLYYVGGLIGQLSDSLKDASATGSVTAIDSAAGGLVGSNWSGTLTGTLSARGNVQGRNYVGGLVGFHRSGIISGNAYATGNVDGSSYVGGLIGLQVGAMGGSAFATGAVHATLDYAGGLIGTAVKSIPAHSYATGSVTIAGKDAGGLIGFNETAQNGQYYAAGHVSANGHMAGLSNVYPGVSGFWDLQVAGIDSSEGGVGFYTAQMKQAASFVGWDFANTWAILEDSTYPGLRIFNNAPFAFADTLPVDSFQFDLTQLLRNDYDLETRQQYLTLQVQSVSVAASVSGQQLLFPDSALSGGTVQLVYRVGELQQPADTLWGNTATAILRMHVQGILQVVGHHHVNDSLIASYVLPYVGSNSTAQFYLRSTKDSTLHLLATQVFESHVGQITLALSDSIPEVAYQLLVKNCSSTDTLYVTAATTIVVDRTPPLAISDLTTLGIHNNQVFLRWTAPADPVQQPVRTQYLLYRLDSTTAWNVDSINTSSMPGDTLFHQLPFATGDSVTLQVRIFSDDSVGNRSDTSEILRAVRMDDDSLPPTLVQQYSDPVHFGHDFHFYAQLLDTSGIWSASVQVRYYWNDSLAGVASLAMTTGNDTLWSTDSALLAKTHLDTLHYQIGACDNDFENDNIKDRSCLWSPWVSLTVPGYLLLSGTMQTLAGDPIVASPISIYQNNQLRTIDSTDSQGRYAFYLDSADTYHLHIAAPGFEQVDTSLVIVDSLTTWNRALPRIGNFDRDSADLVEEADLVLFAKHWHTDTMSSAWNPRYDIGPSHGSASELVYSPDGLINFADMMSFGRVWSQHHKPQSLTKLVADLSGATPLATDSFDIPLAIGSGVRLVKLQWSTLRGEASPIWNTPSSVQLLGSESCAMQFVCTQWAVQLGLQDYVGSDNTWARFVSRTSVPAQVAWSQTVYDENLNLQSTARGNLTLQSTVLPALSPTRWHVTQSTFQTTLWIELSQGLFPLRALRIVDISGRVIRVLPVTLADSRIQWDGQNASGQDIAPGFYWIQGVGGESTEAVRVFKVGQ